MQIRGNNRLQFGFWEYPNYSEYFENPQPLHENPKDSMFSHGSPEEF